FQMAHPSQFPFGLRSRRIVNVAAAKPMIPQSKRTLVCGGLASEFVIETRLRRVRYTTAAMSSTTSTVNIALRNKKKIKEQKPRPTPGAMIHVKTRGTETGSSDEVIV